MSFRTKQGWDMVSFVFWKGLSAHGEWIVAGHQEGVARLRYRIG